MKTKHAHKFKQVMERRKKRFNISKHVGKRELTKTQERAASLPLWPLGTPKSAYYELFPRLKRS